MSFYKVETIKSLGLVQEFLTFLLQRSKAVAEVGREWGSPAKLGSNLSHSLSLFPVRFASLFDLVLFLGASNVWLLRPIYHLSHHDTMDATTPLPGGPCLACLIVKSTRVLFSTICGNN